VAGGQGEDGAEVEAFAQGEVEAELGAELADGEVGGLLLQEQDWLGESGAAGVVGAKGEGELVAGGRRAVERWLGGGGGREECGGGEGE
jgi:hypothetical protein